MKFYDKGNNYGCHEYEPYPLILKEQIDYASKHSVPKSGTKMIFSVSG